jgi:hypothetical protein
VARVIVSVIPYFVDQSSVWSTEAGENLDALPIEPHALFEMPDAFNM